MLAEVVKKENFREREREGEREFEGRKEELEDHDKRENTLKVGRKILDWNRFSLSLSLKQRFCEEGLTADTCLLACSDRSNRFDLTHEEEPEDHKLSILHAVNNPA